ncbi:nitrilase-related carbon-nitrogen hydrolase [Streptomyces sp. ODS05-4]|uniref:nitrilase-related carbon-nitrogen hydrolase n=1 Tax=Streptomyces sp. ODS05-4 TaxID=2944939 RepID=UPI00210D4665|nr:nitrilase-related carbon-nitrogen hydrolase [Streptomyces sp. ODS05-4]
MRASLIQIRVDDSEPVAERRARAAELVAGQRDADLVVLPELWPVGAFAFDSFESAAEPLDGPTHQAMAEAAAAAGVWLHAGSIVERAPDGALFNTSLVYAPSGERAAVYRKIHRFGFDKGEAVLMSAGDELVTVPVPDLPLGLATCYDLRFPELFRGLTDAGALAFAVPAGWPEARHEHWTVLARARAVENQAYVLACGTAGAHADTPQAGRSLIVSPAGEVLAEAAGADELILRAELDPAAATTLRDRFPALKDRRLGLAAPKRGTAAGLAV